MFQWERRGLEKEEEEEEVYMDWLEKRNHPIAKTLLQ
jgi:hypothetical protein